MDFNWKFHLGTNNLVTCTDADFPINMQGVQCLGLTQVGSAKNISDCRNACCGDASCGTYQWCPASRPDGCSPGATCWIGKIADCQNNTGWISMGRPTPAPPIGPAAKNYSDGDWATKNVPHDYVVETGAFNPKNEKNHGYLPKNISWYRKHFSLDSSYKTSTLFIDFDGVYRESQMWINGVFLGHHASGYTSFRYYLNNNLLEFGDNSDNVLAVYVNPTNDEGWWYEGAGVYRHVWLNVVNNVHFKPWGIYLPSNVTNIYNGSKLTGDASMIINATIENNGSSSATVTATFGIVDPNNKVLTNLTQKNIVIGANGTSNFAIPYSAKNIELWDIIQPSLYTVEAVIIDNNGHHIDNKKERFGFRKAYFDVNNGLFLNNRNVKMKGFCNHQDFAGCGTGMPDRVNRYRVQHLQNMGANSWRMSHNPPNPELLDFTDDYGFMVWDENRNFANQTQYLHDQRDMILRDRNHPSIVIWSLCNEAGCMEGKPQSGPVGQLFINVIRQNDGYQRPISAAFNGGWGDALSPLLDIQGVNYNYPELTNYHKQNPNQAVISSESCSCTTDRGEYHSNSTSGHCSAYVGCPWNNDPCPEGCWIPIMQDKFVAGSFDWTGFDYKGEPTPYSWPDINSHFGVIDIAGFPKDNYYYYRSAWIQNETQIYILPNDWTNWKQNDKILVWVYSNCPKIELLLNNKSLGNATVKQLNHATFNVQYSPGVLTAKCRDNNSKVLMIYDLETTNKANAIKMEFEYPYNTNNNQIYGDGQDVCLIKVKIIDNQNRVVPMATNMINFTISGPGNIYGVGNGDPACHEPDKANYRSAWHGLARIIVQSQFDKTGQIKLTAQSDGLQSDTITINVVKQPNNDYSYVV